MPNTEIRIVRQVDGYVTENIETDGFLLLYMKDDTIKMTGHMDIRALTPILTKVLMEKISK